MKSNWLFLFGSLIFDGLAVAWGLRELRSLRRDRNAKLARERKSKQP